MKIIYSILTTLVVIVVAYLFVFSGNSNAKDLHSFILVGTKFSEVQEQFSDNYIKTNSAGDRITYSFLGRNNNLTQFAVKDDIIEVVEVYNVFESADDAVELYTDLCVRLISEEKCHMLRAYNSTIEFIKGNAVVRVEQIPTNYGYLVKFTAFAQ